MIEFEDPPLRKVNKEIQTDDHLSLVVKDAFKIIKKQEIRLRQKTLKIRRLRNQIKTLKKSYSPKKQFSGQEMDSSAAQSLKVQSASKVQWSDGDKAEAMTLRYLSKRAYIYLRTKCSYPLPAISTLKNWASKLEIQPGFLEDIFQYLKISSENREKSDKFAVLQYDEMKVKEIYEYDCKNEQVLGPHKQLQVIMARGLFQNWKQPIFLGFDKTITPELIKESILRLNEAGYEVIACSSDLGGSNFGLWSKMNISIEIPFINNPIDPDKKIFFFADAPHLLKLLRNWLIDTGFQLDGDRIITKNPLIELLRIDNQDLKVCHKLQLKHLNCVGVERQNVRIAAELLSNTTAKALSYYKPGGNEEEADDLSEFIEMVNNWFDVMNSYVPEKNSLQLKCGFGIFEERQIECLNRMCELVSGMRCCGKKMLQPFQKGILVSIRSMKLLLKYTKELSGINYILTHRLNQDSLENFFSQIRTRGGMNDHPSSLDVLYRIRMIIMGKNPGVVQDRANSITSEAMKDEYLVTSVLKEVMLKDSMNDDVKENDLSNLKTDFQEEEEKEEEDAIALQNPFEAGQSYVAGWVAKKFRNKYDFLGDFTYKKNQAEDSINFWIQHLSEGGLVEPSDEWLRISAECEKAFLATHGEQSICKDVNIIRSLVAKIFTKYPHFPKEVITSYMKI